MDDGVSAERMLSEIHSESLQQLLTSVRHAISPAGSTRIAALDAFLCGTRSQRDANSGVAASLNRGDVIEIQGPAASGKTHLLYHLLIICISPREYQRVQLGGWDKAALFFDTDNTFDVSRFRQLLVSYLTEQLSQQYGSLAGHVYQPSFPDLAEEIASSCLQNLHIIRPEATSQLATTLLNLPKYHATHPSLQYQDIGILAIDSMSAFYWKDRYDMEHLRENRRGGDLSSSSPLYHVLTALQNFRLSHGPVIVMTNWGLSPLKKPSLTGEPTSLFYKQHLYPFPSPFDTWEQSSHTTALGNVSSQRSESPEPSTVPLQRTRPQSELDATQPRRSFPLTCHITLHPVPISPFAPTLTLSESEESEPVRAHLVKAGKVQGLVRIPGVARVGEFAFLIRERDVVSDTQ
ncbi:hypothetical protein OBBRIDRAFT_744938, partial [Obba rivulosa]